MPLFPHGHATHPQWQMAASLVLAQLRAQMETPGYAASPTLALLYLTEDYAPVARDILDALSAELPTVTDWAGTVGAGIAVNNAEYWHEPALAVMLCDVPADQYRVFSGVAPLASGAGMGFEPHTALVHADGQLPDLAELIAELAGRTQTGYVFGGLASGRTAAVQFAVSGNGNVRGQGAASGVFEGGVSGVAFGDGVQLLSRVTQGCQPLRPSRTFRIDRAQGHVVLSLDGRPALAVLLDQLGVSLDDPPTAIQALRSTMVGLTAQGSDATGRAGYLGADTRVRHIIGLDTDRQGVAIAEAVAVGDQLSFCHRDVAAARADLVRICTEIRDELESADTVDGAVAGRRMVGAIYVSCIGRGGAYFGEPGAELQIVRRALGDVPLVGFFASGEIARHHLYGYTGVLTVLTGPAD